MFTRSTLAGGLLQLLKSGSTTGSLPFHQRTYKLNSTWPSLLSKVSLIPSRNIALNSSEEVNYRQWTSSEALLQILFSRKSTIDLCQLWTVTVLRLVSTNIPNPSLVSLSPGKTESPVMPPVMADRYSRPYGPPGPAPGAPARPPAHTPARTSAHPPARPPARPPASAPGTPGGRR